MSLLNYSLSHGADPVDLPDLFHSPPATPNHPPVRQAIFIGSPSLSLSL